MSENAKVTLHMLSFVLKDGSNTMVPPAIVERLSLFERRPELLDSSKYAITSNVNMEVLGLFLSGVYGDGNARKKVNQDNVEQLKALCDELGFSGFDAEFQALSGKEVSLERRHLLDLRSRVDRHDVLIEQMQQQIMELRRELQMQVPQQVEAVEKKLMETDRALREEIRSRSVGDFRTESVESGAESPVKTEVARLKETEAKVATAEKAEASQPPVNEELNMERKLIVYDETNSRSCFDGILRFLETLCGGSVRKRRVVKVLCNNFQNGYPPSNMIDEQWRGFKSKDLENSYVRFDFGRSRVAPTHYLLDIGTGIKSWVFEGSNDGESWEVLDEHGNSSDSEFFDGYKRFQVASAPAKSFRFFRVRQTGKNKNENNVLYLKRLELFGALYYPPRPVSPYSQCDFYYLQPLNGIIASLTTGCGGNVVKKGALAVTASSSSEGDLKDVVDFSNERGFSTKDKQNSWIRYDFKKRAVSPNGYCFMRDGAYGPKSWVLEVSNDASSWEVIDRQDDNEDARIYYLLHFSIEDPPCDKYRYVRFRQTGSNSSDNQQLRLVALEIFGKVASR